MNIHKSGHHIIHFITIAILFLNIVLYTIINSFLLFSLILLCSLGFIGLVFAFFRAPYRPVELSNNYLYAPADGKIIRVQKEKEPEYFFEERYKISIFMSLWDVHVNWYPVSGRITYQKYHSGKYLVACHPKSSELNERNTIVIKTYRDKEVLIRQIAGNIARRIVSNASEGKIITQGDEIGIIKFGSRVDIYLPCDARLNVSKGQSVRGNRTIIGFFG